MSETEKELQEAQEKTGEPGGELRELSEEELDQVAGGLLIPAK